MAINPLVHTLSIVPIHQSNLQAKNIQQIFTVFCHSDKKMPSTSTKNYVKSVKITKALKKG
jgi:hypothetical protein